MYLCKNPEYKVKILDELKKADSTQNEETSELTFFTQCFNEAMRLQPPVYYSSSVSMKKDVDAAGLKIRKGDQIYIGMGPLCNSPD